METGTKLIIGCGYLGGRIAQAWKTQGCEVFALTRSESRGAEWEASGLRPLVGDVCDSLPPLPAVDTIVHAVGFDRSAGRSMQSVYVDGLANVLSAVPASLRRFIYISSTGVYGESCGDWVDEDSICQPIREGGRICLAAEQLLRASPLQDRALIFRMAGIYGPGRVPRLTDVRAGKPIAADQEGFLNLIHVEDATEIVVEGAEKLATPGLYCVSDGHPCRRADYFAELSRQVAAPAPRFTSPGESTPQARRALSSKRISNQRLMRDLSPKLKHPTYREGLRAILAGDSK